MRYDDLTYKDLMRIVKNAYEFYPVYVDGLHDKIPYEEFKARCPARHLIFKKTVLATLKALSKPPRFL